LKAKAVVNEVSRFYRAQDQPIGTHLAVRWKDRVRFILPRDTAAQKAYWKIFHPGWLELPLRAIACLPRPLGLVSCVESHNLAIIRKAIGAEAGLSCCHVGAPGVWSKVTLLFVDKKTAEPLYFVKAGFGEAVGSLLCNEASWLRTMRDQASLTDHIPELVIQRSEGDLSFLADRPLPGKIEYKFGKPHIEFLRKFQDFSRQTKHLDESRIYQNLRARLNDLSGLLSEAWSTRLDLGMQRIERSLSGQQILFVAAHNDFTPWNIRVNHGVARAFDWEYADYDQLPLFDPLHFILLPMALRSQPTVKMIASIHQMQQMCSKWLGNECCCAAQTQTLIYLINVCTLYLWSDRGAFESHPVLNSYARIIDRMCI
jgi:hypothetical protein